MAQLTRSATSKRKSRRPEPKAAAIERSVFRVILADLFNGSECEKWTPTSVWETPEFEHELNHVTLVSSETVGGTTLEACREFAAQYNQMKLLDRVDMGASIRLWALVICGLPDDEGDDEEQDADE